MRPARIAKTLLKAAVSVALIAVVMHAFNVKGAAGRVLDIAPGALGAGVLLALAVALVHAARWIAVIRSCGGTLAFGKALKFVLIGHFFNQTLPSSVGGDAMRIWCAYRAGFTLAHATGTVVLDRMMTLVALLVATGAMLPWLFALVPDAAARWALSVVIIAGLAGFLVFVSVRRLPDFLARWRPVGALLKLAGLARRLVMTPRYGLPVLGLSIAGYAVFALIVFLIGRGLAVPLTLAQCLVLVPPVILATVVPVSIAGWGVREGAMVVALGHVNVPPTDAFAISVLFGVVLVVASLPGSLLWWWASGHDAPRSGPA